MLDTTKMCSGNAMLLCPYFTGNQQLQKLFDFFRHTVQELISYLTSFLSCGDAFFFGLESWVQLKDKGFLYQYLIRIFMVQHFAKMEHAEMYAPDRSRI